MRSPAIERPVSVSAPWSRRAFDLAWVTRLHNALAAAGAVAVGMLVAGGSPGERRAVTAMVAIAATTACANVVNDLRDVDVDRRAKPDRPIPSGRLSPRVARVVAAALGGVAVLVAFALPATLGAVGVLILGLAVAYSIWLKGLVLVGNATVAALSASTVVFGGAVAGHASARVWLASGFVFVYVLASEVLKTAADGEADRQSGVLTLAARYGVAVTLSVYRWLCLSFGLLVAVVAIADRSLALLIGLGVGALGPLLAAVLATRRDATRLGLERAVLAMKIGWVGGLVALIELR